MQAAAGSNPTLCATQHLFGRFPKSLSSPKTPPHAGPSRKRHSHGKTRVQRAVQHVTVPLPKAAVCVVEQTLWRLSVILIAMLASNTALIQRYLLVSDEMPKRMRHGENPQNREFHSQWR